MFVSKTALPVIDVPESFQHHPYWSNDDLPVSLERLVDLVDGAKARDIRVVQIFQVVHPSPICRIQNTGARSSTKNNWRKRAAHITSVWPSSKL